MPEKFSAQKEYNSKVLLQKLKEQNNTVKRSLQRDTRAGANCRSEEIILKNEEAFLVFLIATRCQNVPYLRGVLVLGRVEAHFMRGCGSCINQVTLKCGWPTL